MLGENLKTIRKEKGFTRNQLSILSGVTAQTIKMIEMGKNDNPRLKTLISLSKTLKIPINKLIK